MKRIIISENKLELLFEGFGDIIYHFASVENCLGILNDGKIGLTMSSNSSDAYDNKRLFYLSTQRSKSLNVGYAYNSSKNGDRSIARIELDGYELKKDGYNGLPLDYWGELQGKQSDIGKNSSRIEGMFGNREISGEDILKMQQHNENFEIEDRIISDKPYLPIKYITRIDIYIGNQIVRQRELGNKGISKKYVDILNKSKELGINTFIYDEIKYFNYGLSDKCINHLITNENTVVYPQTDKPNWNYDKIHVDILKDLVQLYFYYDKDYYTQEIDNFKTKITSLLDKFNLGKYVDQVADKAFYYKGDVVELSYHLGNSEQIRKLNTKYKSEDSENVMLLAQHVLNRYKVSNFRDLAKYFNSHKWGEENKPLDGSQKEVKCLKRYSVDFNGNEPLINFDEYTIIDGENKLFWERVDKESFYRDIERIMEYDEYYDSDKEYGFIIHSSKNNDSFLKYIQHLMHNDKLDLYDGIKMIYKLSGGKGDNFKKNCLYLFSEYFEPILLTKPLAQRFDRFIYNYDDRKDIINKLWGHEDNFWNDFGNYQ